MKWLQNHVRNKLVAGVLAATPMVIVCWAAVTIELYAQPLTEPVGFYFPGLGILIALAAVYLLGLLVTSIVGTLVLGAADNVLRRLPGFKLLYQAWKDVLVLAPSKAGMYHQVVLVPSPDGKRVELGFASGEPLPGDPQSCCVFLPNAPNPLSGRVVLIRRDACRPLELSVEEAFKFLLSSGNYLPVELQGSRVERPAENPSGRG